MKMTPEQEPFLVVRPYVFDFGHFGTGDATGIAQNADLTKSVADLQIERFRNWRYEQMVLDLGSMQSAFTKIDTAKQSGQPAQFTDNETKVLIREIVNNPAMLDSNLGRQYQALTSVEKYIKQAGALGQPAKTTDPAILSNVMIAFPNLTQQSNLQGAKVTALYVEPGQDGGEARAMVGISGGDNTGEDVSDHGLTIRGWLSQARCKKKLADGILAIEASRGKKEAVAEWDKMQQNKEAGNMLLSLASRTEDEQTQKELIVAGTLILDGTIGSVNLTELSAEDRELVHNARKWYLQIVTCPKSD